MQRFPFFAALLSALLVGAVMPEPRPWPMRSRVHGRTSAGFRRPSPSTM